MTMLSLATDPWPSEVPSLGPRSVGCFTRCADCAATPRPDETIVAEFSYHVEVGKRRVTAKFCAPPRAGTWSYYDGRPLCHAHARLRLDEAR